MDKVVKFLEAYVQWVALGIGAVVLLWAGYAYLATPTTVTTPVATSAAR